MVDGAWFQRFANDCPVCVALELLCEGAPASEVTTLTYAAAFAHAKSDEPICMCRRHDQAFERARDHAADAWARIRRR